MKLSRPTINFSTIDWDFSDRNINNPDYTDYNWNQGSLDLWIVPYNDLIKFMYMDSYAVQDLWSSKHRDDKITNVIHDWNEGKKLSPIVLFRDGYDKLTVVSGNHRFSVFVAWIAKGGCDVGITIPFLINSKENEWIKESFPSSEYIRICKKMNYLPNMDLFKYPYEVPIYREATDEELIDNPKLFFQDCGKIQDGVERTLSTSKDVIKYIVEKNGDNEYENCLDDLLKSFPEYKKWESAFNLSPDSELYAYQNERTSNYDKLDEEIRKHNFYLNDGQRVFRGAFGDIRQKKYSFSTPISTTLYSVVAYSEIIRNVSKDEDRIIFDLIANNSTTNVFYYGSNTGAHSNEKEVLFASGAKIQIIGDYEKIGEIDTHLGKRPLYYVTGIIT